MSLLPYLPPFVFSHQYQDLVLPHLKKICEETHCMKNKQLVLKQNSLKSFLQKSGDKYFYTSLGTHKQRQRRIQG